MDNVPHKAKQNQKRQVYDLGLGGGWDGGGVWRRKCHYFYIHGPSPRPETEKPASLLHWTGGHWPGTFCRLLQ